MSEIALLGGSFNPPHVAHQIICLWALSTGRAQAVWWMPTFAHALGKPLAAFEHRARMCELCLADLPAGQTSVSRIEAELETPNRTLNTLQHLTRTYPEHRFSLLIGADLLAQSHEWYAFDEVCRLARLIVVERDGYASVGDTIQPPAISSSQIRDALAAGRDISHWLPWRVEQYIRGHDLYGGTPGAPHVPA